MATAPVNRESDFVTRVRTKNRAAWKLIQNVIQEQDELRTIVRDLREEQSEWNAQDYGNALGPEIFAVGEHEALTKEQIGAALFDSANALETLLGDFVTDLTTLLNTGHATNMSSIL